MAYDVSLRCETYENIEVDDDEADSKEEAVEVAKEKVRSAVGQGSEAGRLAEFLYAEEVNEW